MPNLIVSAHGGRYSTQEPTLVVPEKSEVVFYVTDGGILSNTDGQKIFEALQKKDEPGGKVAQRIMGGGKTYDYSCWYAAEFAAYCGIYAVGSPIAFDNLKAYTPKSPLLLSRILATYPNRVVYWVACREITPAGELLSNPEGAYPQVAAA